MNLKKIFSVFALFVYLGSLFLPMASATASTIDNPDLQQSIKNILKKSENSQIANLSEDTNKESENRKTEDDINSNINSNTENATIMN